MKKVENPRIFKKPVFSRRIKDFIDRLNGLSPALETDLRAFRQTLEAVRGYDFSETTDDGLRARVDRLREQVRSGVGPDTLLPEIFALTAEASKRWIGLDPFDVQLLAGLAMHLGRIAELPTGEGKTLAAVFPACLNGLTGRGVHVLTFNDYLARRDAAWMGPVYSGLGFSVGVIQEGLSLEEKRAAYRCDITYATAKEAGFDFLRDQLAYSPDELVHRPFYFALVDEADSILIDEARVPLVIAGLTSREQADDHSLAEIIETLVPGKHYATDDEERNVHFTDSGIEFLEQALHCDNLHAAERLSLLTSLNCALHAEVLLRRDRDYIVRNGRIEIVDEFTGRVVEHRHWPDGLQAAVEAKEGLRFKSEGAVLGSITLQHLFRLYPKLSGMTATAESSASEFREFYGLTVTVIPPHCPCVRIDCPDFVFQTQKAKKEALIDEIRSVHASGRPVLVGTGSVQESEDLARALSASAIRCHVLNAKNDEQEAKIVARAGRLGAVTISTNMAGRGTDIRLGGTDEKERRAVSALGGLYVIGTNRHESLRIDLQLRGRAGRQGDRGSTRFFISLEDSLIRRYGIQKMFRPWHTADLDGRRLVNPVINREIARAQRIIEAQNLEIRKTLRSYSSLIEDQRRLWHRRRTELLMSDPSTEGFLKHNAPAVYRKALNTLGEETLPTVEKRLAIRLLDDGWMNHLAFLNDRRESIHLESLGGKTPLGEFQREAAEAFRAWFERHEADFLMEMKRILTRDKPIDIEDEALRGPASTWTYLINDEQFGWAVGMMQGGNIGFTAAAAAWYGPLYLFLSLYHRYIKPKARREEANG